MKSHREMDNILFSWQWQILEKKSIAGHNIIQKNNFDLNNYKIQLKLPNQKKQQRMNDILFSCQWQSLETKNGKEVVKGH